MNIDEAMKAVERITAKGSNAEIRKAPDGSYIVMEVLRRKVKMN